MRIQHWLAGFCSLFLLAATPSFAAAPQAYVHDFAGDVQAIVGTAKPVNVARNQHLGDNTTITTGANSNAVLKFTDGTVIALNQNTSFIIQKYNYNEQSPSTMSAVFAMLRGGLRTLTGAMSSKNRDAFRLATPVATMGIRGTEFMVQMVNPLYLQVISGAVSATNAMGSAMFAAGQSAVVATSTTLAAAIPAVPTGTFGVLPSMVLPPALPGPLPVPGAAGATGAAAGGISAGAAVGLAAAAAAAVAVAIGGGEDSPGTTGTTGTR